MGVGRILKSLAASAFPGALVVGGRAAADAPVAVTFDDGPHPGNTPSILAALAAARAHATFFVQGQEAQRYPSLVRDIHDAGHQVANHAFSHRDARKTAAGEYIDEVARTHDLLCDITRQDLPRDFRPPYGTITAPTFVGLTRRGYRFVFWSKDSRDSFVRSPELLVPSVNDLDIAQGDIVLFHEDYAHTAAALPAILAMLGARALRLGTTAELGRRRAPGRRS